MGFSACFFVVVIALCLFGFLLTSTSQKSASVSESASYNHAPGRCHSSFELKSQIVLISALVPETKDAFRLKGSHFVSLDYSPLLQFEIIVGTET